MQPHGSLHDPSCDRTVTCAALTVSSVPTLSSHSVSTTVTISQVVCSLVMSADALSRSGPPIPRTPGDTACGWRMSLWILRCLEHGECFNIVTQLALIHFVRSCFILPSPGATESVTVEPRAQHDLKTSGCQETLIHVCVLVWGGMSISIQYRPAD